MRLLVRRDRTTASTRASIYVPRDRYNTEVRQRIEQHRARRLRRHARRDAGADLRFEPRAPARAWCARTAERPPQGRTSTRIEQRIADGGDDLERPAAHGADRAAATKRARSTLASRYRRSVPAGLSGGRRAGARRSRTSPISKRCAPSPRQLRLNLYRARATAGRARAPEDRASSASRCPISDILPMLENFGLRVIAERPYELAWPEGGDAWIQDFELEHRDRHARRHRAHRAAVQGSLRSPPGAARSRTTASTACCSRAGLSAREIVVLRAYCRYLLQTGVPFSQAYMERTLAAQCADRAAPGAAVRDAVRSGPARPRARRAPRSIIAEHPRGARQGHEPRRGPHPARATSR